MSDTEFSDSDDLFSTETSSSDDDDDLELLLEVRRHPKNEGYFEDTIPQYNNKEFVEHFRVSREVAENIAERFSLSQYYHHQAGEFGKITALKFVLVFLWFAGHESAGYRDVSDRFNITTSSLHKIVKRMTYFLSNLSPEVIRWPTAQDKREIQAHFEANGFPGVIGVIDGTQIRIDRPSTDPDSYLNRKHFSSFQAQVVCDHQRRIRDVFIGQPGSVHDSRVFRTSPLSDTLEEKCGNSYILGDSGYPCLRHLLTPFRDRGQLRRAEINYNVALARNRYVIEHCFGILKQKFRQLYHIKLRIIEDMVHFFRACCVLHNLAINDDFQVEVDENYENMLGARAIEDDGENNRDARDGIEMRNHVVRIMEYNN